MRVRIGMEERQMALLIVYVRTLQKAADILGSRNKLARHLRVTQVELERWMAANEIPPIDAFLKAVELILDDTGGSEPGETPPSRSASDTSPSIEPADLPNRRRDG